MMMIHYAMIHYDKPYIMMIVPMYDDELRFPRFSDYDSNAYNYECV